MVEGVEDAEWFWQGNEGWVQYPRNIASQIETAYHSSRDSVDVDRERYLLFSLFSFFSYILSFYEYRFIDFDTMNQVRKDDDSKRRAVKRDVVVHIEQAH